MTGMYNPSDEVPLGSPKVLILPKKMPNSSTAPSPPCFWTLEQDFQELEAREKMLLDEARSWSSTHTKDLPPSAIFSMMEEAEFVRRSEALKCIMSQTLRALPDVLKNGSNNTITYSSNVEAPFYGVIDAVIRYTIDGISQANRLLLPLACSPLENELRRGLTTLHLLLLLNHKLSSLPHSMINSDLIHNLIHMLSSTDVYFETVPLLSAVSFLTTAFTLLAEGAGRAPMDTVQPSVWIWMEDRVQEELTRRANRWRFVAPWRPTPLPHMETQSVLHSHSRSATATHSVSDIESQRENTRGALLVSANFEDGENQLASSKSNAENLLSPDPTPSILPPQASKSGGNFDNNIAPNVSTTGLINAPLSLEIREWFTQMYKELLPVSSRFIRLLVRIFFASLPSSSPAPPAAPNSSANNINNNVSNNPGGSTSPLNIFSELPNCFPSNSESGASSGSTVSRFEGDVLARAVDHQEQFLMAVPRLALAYLACATHAHKMQGHAIRLLFVEHNMLLVSLKFLTVDFEAYLKLPSSASNSSNLSESSDMSVSPIDTSSSASSKFASFTSPLSSPATNRENNSNASTAIGSVSQKQRIRRRATVTAVLRLMSELVAGSDVRVKSLTRFRAEHTLKRLLMTCANPKDPQDHHLLYSGYLLLQLLLPLVPGRLQGPLMPLVTMMYNHNPPLLPIPFVWPPPPPALPGSEADAPSLAQEQAEAKLRTMIDHYNQQMAATYQPTSAEVISAEQLESVSGGDDDYWIQLNASAQEWLSDALKRYSFDQLFEVAFPHLATTAAPANPVV